LIEQQIIRFALTLVKDSIRCGPKWLLESLHIFCRKAFPKLVHLTAAIRPLIGPKIFAEIVFIDFQNWATVYCGLASNSGFNCRQFLQQTSLEEIKILHSSIPGEKAFMI
jgi:hypothetical protein